MDISMDIHIHGKPANDTEIMTTFRVHHNAYSQQAAPIADHLVSIFSERELTFTFAMSSSVRLSSVCNVRASYLGD